MSPNCDFSVFLLLWPWQLGQGHKNLISSYYVQNIYPCKFGKNPTTGSQDIVQTRKCHADANALNSIFPLPIGLGINNIVTKIYSCCHYFFHFFAVIVAKQNQLLCDCHMTTTCSNFKTVMHPVLWNLQWHVWSSFCSFCHFIIYQVGWMWWTVNVTVTKCITVTYQITLKLKINKNKHIFLHIFSTF